MKRTQFNRIFILSLQVAAGIAIVMGLVLIIIYFPKHHLLSAETNQETLGLIGEFFGGTVGPIWALAGVILFYLALIYQKNELELQREELKETRKIMESQSETIAIQQFENTFFQLLDFHLNAASKIIHTEGGNVFDKIFTDFKKSVTALKKKRKTSGGMDVLDEEAYENSFKNVFDGYRDVLQYYFESFRTLVIFIGGKSKDPAFYYRILKAHLTEQEVLIQFYYIILYSKDKMLKELSEEYNLLEKLNLRAVHEIDKFHLEGIKDEAYHKES